MNLQGLRVLNTRPLEQGLSLNQAIEQAGGHAIHCPALVIEASDQSWLSLQPVLTEVKQAIFISANAVNYYFTALTNRQVIWPSTIQVIAVGQATAAALKKWGIQTVTTPEIADSEHLLALPSLQTISEEKILLIKGEGGRPLLEETLLSRGAELVVLAVYQRNPPLFAQDEIHSLWHNDAVDIILFTSQQAMQNIFALCSEDAQTWLCTKPCLVVSERLAKAASLLGIKTVIVSSPETIVKTLGSVDLSLIK